MHSTGNYQWDKVAEVDVNSELSLAARTKPVTHFPAVAPGKGVGRTRNPMLMEVIRRSEPNQNFESCITESYSLSQH